MEFHELVARAEASGVAVMTRNIGRHHGRYLLKHRLIMLSPRLSGPQTISALGHELAHAYFGDDGPQPPELEARAWRWAAHVLITPQRYAAAELVVGTTHLGAIARELGVTRQVVEAWQDVQVEASNVRYINFGHIEQGA